MEIEEKTRVKGNNENIENDMWVSELIDLVKSQCKRWAMAFFAVLGLWAATIAGFIWYLNQYDFVSTVEQNGVYTLIDSEGNVISSDISPNQVIEIMEIINNGKDESGEKTD